jgi:hypothetical protein
MKQTAVEQLVEQLKKRHLLNFTGIDKIIEQAKAMEKDNVCDAWDDGYDKGMRDRIEKISNPVGNAEQYYNKTFKSE